MKRALLILFLTSPQIISCGSDELSSRRIGGQKVEDGLALVRGGNKNKKKSSLPLKKDKVTCTTDDQAAPGASSGKEASSDQAAPGASSGKEASSSILKLADEKADRGGTVTSDGYESSGTDGASDDGTCSIIWEDAVESPIGRPRFIGAICTLESRSPACVKTGKGYAVQGFSKDAKCNWVPANVTVVKNDYCKELKDFGKLLTP
jgi:hypothetical protein